MRDINYNFDLNGNLTLQLVDTERDSSHCADTMGTRVKNHLWDEENRLLAINDNGFISNYFYDAAGERTVKLSKPDLFVYVNSSEKLKGDTLPVKFVGYVSPYLVVTNGGRYTKHIYAGTQRIASKLGDINAFGADPRRVATAGHDVDGAEPIDFGKKYGDQNNAFTARFDSLDSKFNGKSLDDYVNGKSFCCRDNSLDEIEKNETNSAENAKLEDNLYFYHPDHLGSTNLITNFDGEVTQSVAYIPYGEVFVEERNGNWATPYLFNAKELDEETGLYYYGARYLDPTDCRWLSPDPMQGKYPGMTPYNYCAGNPVRYIDPDGRRVEVNDEESQSKSLEYITEELGENHGFSFNDKGELKYTKNNSYKNYNENQKALYKGLRKLIDNKDRTINIEITNDNSKKLFNIDIKRGDELVTNAEGKIVYDNNGLPKMKGNLNVVATATVDITSYGGAFLYSNDVDCTNTGYVKINTSLLGTLNAENGGVFKPTDSSVFFHEILDHGLDYVKNGNTIQSNGNSINNVKYQNHALQNKNFPLRKEHHH